MNNKLGGGGVSVVGEVSEVIVAGTVVVANVGVNVVVTLKYYIHICYTI